jgi:hypothetical protein
MTLDYGRLAIQSVIVHQIPRTGQGAPVFSEVESPLDADLKSYIKRKIVASAASSYAFPVLPIDGTESPVPDTVKKYLSAPRAGFAGRSRIIADYLVKIQSRLNSEGLLTIVDGDVQTQRVLAVLKLEREAGVSVNTQSIGGKRTLVIQHVGELMLTDSTKVFKAGVFAIEGTALAGVASDHQRSNHDVARFFLEKFLGCTYVEKPPVATKRFFEATEEFINRRIKDPRTQVKYQIALSAEMNNSRSQLRPRSFATDNLNAPDVEPYMKFLEENGALQSTYKDTKLVEGRMAGLQLSFTSGTTVFAPPAALESRKVIVEATESGDARVTVTDKLRSTKGKGRSRGKKPT